MYTKQRHIHFMGIGGIGMSGIAEILRLQGYIVSGCDLSCVVPKKDIHTAKILSDLQEIGCTLYPEHSADHINSADVLVYSSAIDKNHPEIVRALEKGIPVIPRAIMLAELMRMKYGIAVSGAHGKTTTTSIISHILIEADFDPTVVIGGVLKNISANAKLGGGDILIAEADESDRSLLYLNPCIAVVTNIDAEHLDTYKDLADIKQTFKDFLSRLPFFGKAFLCIDDPNIASILPLPHVCTVKYGLTKNADVYGKVITLEKTHSIFEVYVNTNSAYYRDVFLRKAKSARPESKKDGEFELLGQITLNIPGEHNVANSLAAIGLSLELEVPFERIQNALKIFKGVERRFEFKGLCKGTEVFDDYGHHPTEIQKTLIMAQRRTNKKLHVVFQPHRFTRTQKLWNEFVETFAGNKNISTLYLTDIYPASEKPIPEITSQNLVKAIQAKNPNIKVFYCSSYDEIIKNVPEFLGDGDLLLTIGAGKVNQIGEKLVNQN